MLRDLLQKRLQEMERNNPSPSLETAKPTLRERAGFLGRYFSRTVKQVPQRSAIYSSLDDQINDYQKAVEFEGHTDQGQYWINKAFKDARSGETWGGIETDLRIAAKESGFNNSISPDLMKKLETIYSIGMKVEGPKKARSWIDKAFEDARSGEIWSGIETDLRISGIYARESGIELDVDMDSLKAAYKLGIKTFGPEKVKYWRKKAGEALSEGVSKDQFDSLLRIARDYASEAGVNFEF